MHEGSRRAILAAFLANLGIAIAKFVGFLITGSAGLLAEAGHSLADTGNQLLLLLGGKRAATGGRHGAPVRLRARALLLGVRRRPRAVLDGRPVRPLRGHREAAPPARRREPRRGHRHPDLRHGAREPVAAHRLQGGLRATAPGTAGGWAGSGARSSRSCRSCCSRTPAPSSASCSRSTGVTLAHVTGEPRWDALGLDRHRPAARRHRHPAGDRDEGPADRRVGEPGGRRGDRHGPRAGAVGAAHHPPADRAPRPRRPARRGQARVRPDADGRGAGGRDRRRPSGTCAPSCRPPTSCSSSPTSYRAAGDVTATVATSRRDRINAVAPIGVLAMVAAVLAFSSSSTIIKWAEVPGSVAGVLADDPRRRAVVDRRRRPPGPHRPPAAEPGDVPARAARPASRSGSTSRCSSPPSARRASPTPSSSPPSARSCSCRSAPCCSTSAPTRGRCRGASCRSPAWRSCCSSAARRAAPASAATSSCSCVVGDVDRLPRQRPPGAGDGRRRRLHGDDDADRRAHRGAGGADRRRRRDVADDAPRAGSPRACSPCSRA